MEGEKTLEAEGENEEKETAKEEIAKPSKENVEEIPSTEEDQGKIMEGDQNVEKRKVEGEKDEEEHVEGEHVKGDHSEIEQVKQDNEIEGELDENQHAEEEAQGPNAEKEQIEGEHIEGEHIQGEKIEGEEIKKEQVEGEHIEGEEINKEDVDRDQVEGEITGEETDSEQAKAVEQEGQEEKTEEVVEEEGIIEEPPLDPAAPYNFSDSQEALKIPYELRPEQFAEVEQLWEAYQNYTPAYSDIDGYITEKELVYMLKALLVMTYTPEQLEELISFCVRPPHPEGHINFDQFVKMVTLRQRDFPYEEELRSALQVLDPDKSGVIDREYMREVLYEQGYDVPHKQLDSLIKEVDVAQDGTIGIEDVVGTMCIDLNTDDLVMLRESLFPKPKVEEEEEEF